jgi:hypothetical protein
VPTSGDVVEVLLPAGWHSRDNRRGLLREMHRLYRGNEADLRGEGYGDAFFSQDKSF